jgi:hypothetical protein
VDGQSLRDVEQYGVERFLDFRRFRWKHEE